jgi:hypothetical protein
MTNMISHPTRSSPAPAEASAGRRGRAARLGRVASSLSGVVGFLLLPKCPLCLAALLGVVGLGAGTASLVAPLLRPAALLLAAATLLFLLGPLAGSARRSRAARASHHPGGPSPGACPCSLDPRDPLG